MIVQLPSDRQRSSRARAEGASTSAAVTRGRLHENPGDPRPRASLADQHGVDTESGLRPPERQRIRALSREDIEGHNMRSGDVRRSLSRIRKHVETHPGFVGAASAFLTPSSGKRLLSP